MTTQYTKLAGSELGSLSSTCDLESSDHAEDCSCPLKAQSPERTFTSSNRAVSILLYTLSSVAIGLICFMLGRYTYHQEERLCLDTAWDEVRDAVRFKTLDFNPRFTGPPSPYMGPPNPELDHHWEDLSALLNFGVEAQVLEKINQTRGAAEFPEIGRYQVGLEVYHQLHCLNYIRMYTYHDYYAGIDYDMIGETKEDQQEHKDHCIEVLRQRLMCNADLNIYPYHWVEEFDMPVGHLFTRHHCVDWDHFHDWAKSTAVRRPPLRKPTDAELWF